MIMMVFRAIKITLLLPDIPGQPDDSVFQNKIALLLGCPSMAPY